MFKKPKRIPQTKSSSSSSSRVHGNDTGPDQDDDDDDDNFEYGNSTSNSNKKRFRTRNTANTSSSSDDDDDDGDSDKKKMKDDDNLLLLQQARKEQREQIQNTKKARMNIISNTSNNNKNNNSRSSSQQVLHHYQSVDVSKILTQKDFATRTAEYHTVEKKNHLTTTTSLDDSKGGNDKYGDTTKEEDNNNNNMSIYKGNQQVRNKFLAGPIRASTFVRTTCRFDYQPDICKDYKETGFCGFGDTCIYLHDRGDTKSGWQIEKEWEEKRKREMELKEKAMDQFILQFQEKEKSVRSRGDDNTNLKEEEGDKNIWEGEEDRKKNQVDDGIPFACFLCRGPFQEPVVTSCGHYFCQRCILKQVQEAKSTTACPICSKDTNGVFNHPMKLVAKKRRVVGLNGTWEEFERVMKT